MPHEHPNPGQRQKGEREMKAAILATAVALTMTACVSTPQYRPVVDHGVSTGDYETDLSECTQLAQSSRATAGKGAVGGAIVGALLGAALGRAAGLSGDYTQRVAAVGAAQGTVAGGAATHSKQTEIISKCVAGRGWNVVAS